MLTTFQRASEIVPENLDATKWPELEPLYRGLIAREIRSANDLRKLVMDRSELDAAASEAGSRLYIEQTCHTDSEGANKAYIDFIENVEPRLKEVGFELDKKIASSPHARELEPGRFDVYMRSTRLGVTLFRPENVAIETDLAKLEQQYRQVCGAMTVTFRGEEKTLPQMARYNEDTDRATREEAWKTVAERRFRDHEKIEALYEQMLGLRAQVAKNAGFANYRDYAHTAKRRFDYTPQMCHDYAAGVEKVVVPALRRLNAARAKGLGLAKLRPWDLAVDVKGRAPLRPFENAAEMVERTGKVFTKLDPDLSGMFEVLRRPGPDGKSCLDLESRKGKAPGGYQANRDRMRLPFIFMNAAGVQRDVETMVHEAGHAFHSLLSRHDPLLMYRSDIPLEFAEVASMSMELLTHPFLDEYYAPGDAARATRWHLEQLATMLPWIATIDQFQQWIYTTPGHTVAQRQAKWLELNDRFGPAADWSGLEPQLRTQWHRQMHLFGSPFYYIEYGIAQLGALQLWLAFLKDRGAAVGSYKRALALGGSRPLPELFGEAGLKFEFGEAMIGTLWNAVEEELARLPE
jgi:oligoendopeptidase F